MLEQADPTGFHNSRLYGVWGQGHGAPPLVTGVIPTACGWPWGWLDPVVATSKKPRKHSHAGT